MEPTGPSAQAAEGPRRVYIIDDDADVRRSLHFALATSSITAWPFAGAADFLDQLPGLAPAPILLDIRMPVVDGLQMLAILQDRLVTWPVIVMTAYGNVKVAVEAMKLGAIDFLEKPFQPELLGRVLDRAFGYIENSDLSRRTREEARRLIRRLSSRENEIVSILIKGVPNKVAAFRLGLSTRTVEMHRGKALAKLELKSIAEVVALVATADLSPRPHASNTLTP